MSKVMLAMLGWFVQRKVDVGLRVESVRLALINFYAYIAPGCRGCPEGLQNRTICTKQSHLPTIDAHAVSAWDSWIHG